MQAGSKIKQACIRIYAFCFEKHYHKHVDTNKKAKETNEEKRQTKEPKEEKEIENVVAVNSI